MSTGSRMLHGAQIARVAREVDLWWARTRHRASRLARGSSPRAGSPIRVLAWTPTYVPQLRRGSEVTLHAVLRGLQARGFDCRVLIPGEATEYEIDDVVVVRSSDRRRWQRLVRDADLVIAQLDRHRPAKLAALAGKPFVFYVHIGNARTVSAGRPDLTIFTSDVVRRQQPEVAPAIVINPVIRQADYATTHGEALTCINLSDSKGGPLFFELARRLPEESFLGVTASGSQAVPDPLPANCTLLDQHEDMRSVYGRTRVLLVPSLYEAYGRVALEAAASGIPAIAHPCAGIAEAMGDSALWADRDDIEAWINLITRLRDPAYYAERSELARRRFDELRPDEDLDRLAARLRQLVTELS